ncbi:MAG: hypothetical protein SGI77_16455 [Pirellulaceae bacterium]|nr:hypothetical protein [Pirellulaceae bacterium]
MPLKSSDVQLQVGGISAHVDRMTLTINETDSSVQHLYTTIPMRIHFGNLAGYSMFAVVIAAVPLLAASSNAQENDPLWTNVTASATMYQILPRPVGKHEGKHLPYSTTQQPTEKPYYESHSIQPYSYGWFGPRSTPQWSRHFGYHQGYTQWSLK